MSTEEREKRRQAAYDLAMTSLPDGWVDKFEELERQLKIRMQVALEKEELDKVLALATTAIAMGARLFADNVALVSCIWSEKKDYMSRQMATLQRQTLEELASLQGHPDASETTH